VVVVTAVAQQTRSAAGAVRRSLRDPLHSNAHALLLGSVITSVLGLVFWALAARLFPPDQVGLATSAIAAMTFLANTAALGLKNGLLRFLPVAGGAARRLVLRSYALCALVAAGAAGVFLLGVPLWADGLEGLRSSPMVAVSFVLATSVWVVFVLQDHVLVALDRTAWVPTANGAYALVKIIALFLVAGGSFWSVFAVHTVPALVAVAAVTVVVLRAAPRPQGGTADRTGAPPIHGLVRFAATDHAATLLLLAVANLLPLVVLARTGAADSAFYYMAFTIANSLYLVTADVGSSFVTRAARDPDRAEQMARRACAHALLLVVPAVAAGCLLAPVLLGLLGPDYAVAGTPLLQLLLLSAVPHVVVGLAINLAQVRQQMRRVLGIQAAVAAGTFVAADAGLRQLGLTGVGWAWLGTQTVLALVLLATQLRFLRRRPGLSTAAADDRTARAVRRTVPAASGRAPAAVRARLARIRPAVFPPLLAVVLWAAPFVGVAPADMTDLGILSLLAPLSAVALVVLTLGFGWSLTRSRSDALPALHVVVLIVLLHGTPALLFGTVRYSWSWKHLGIVDFIQRHGAVDVSVASMPIYHNWPGFFGGSAVLTDLAGLADAQTLALWAPLAFNLANLLVLLALFRSLVADRRRVWLAVWLFFVTTWIGQDYFSPQAVAFVLHLAVLTLLVRRYRRPWPAGIAAAPLTGRGPALVVLLLVLAIVSSHQITPVVLVITLTALALLRVLPVGRFALVAIAAGVGWAVTVAGSWTIPNVTSIVGSFLDPVGNVGATLDKAADLRGAQVLVSFGGRAVVAITAALAVAGVVVAVRNRSLDRVALVLLVSPLTLVALTSFGGETLFRVVLFAAPAVAYFGAGAVLAAADRVRWPQPLRSPALGTAAVVAAVVPGFLLGHYGTSVLDPFLDPVGDLGATPGGAADLGGAQVLVSSGGSAVVVITAALVVAGVVVAAAARSRWPRSLWSPALGTAVVTAAVLPGFLLGYYGKDQQNYFSTAEVAALEWVAENAPPGSLLVVGNTNYPRDFRNYENVTVVDLSTEPDAERRRVLAAPDEVLLEWLTDDRYRAAYVVLTRSQSIANDSTGPLTPGTLDELGARLRASGAFDAPVDGPDAVVLVARPGTREEP
jgi:O-antigen/teichoic acid export membrane protein